MFMSRQAGQSARRGAGIRPPLLLVGLSCALVLLVAGSAWATPTPTYHLRIRAVLTANDDGSRAATITAAQIKTLVANANAVWSSAGIWFDFNPATDIEYRKSTLLNNDCTIFDPLGNTVCDTQPNAEARDGIALDAAHDSKITVYFRYGGTSFACTGLGSCSVKQATIAFSSRAGHYVAMFGGGSGAFTLAHELGHYLWNSHTFGSTPATLHDAQVAIVNYVQGAHPHPMSEGLNVFDGDRNNGDAADTPPDPGTTFWAAMKGDACATGPGSGSQSVTVTFSGGAHKTYTLAPDRSNIMSYFISCPGLGHTSSPQQRTRARSAVALWNRGQLIGKTPSYARLDVRWTGNSAAGTSVMPFMLDRRPHLLIYHATTGLATVVRVKDDPRDGTKTVMSANLGAGWTTLTPFVLNGAPHALLYNAATGKAKIIKLVGILGWTNVWQGGFQTGWTRMMPFVLNGAPHALLYKGATGTAKVIRLVGGTQGVTAVWAGAFSTGWSSLTPIRLGNAPHVVLYNAANGHVKVIRVLGAPGFASVWDGSWSTGWTAFMAFDRGAQQRLLAYKAASGQLNAVRIRPDGSGAVLLATTTWPKGYDALVAARLPGTWTAFAHDADTSAARIAQITE